MTATATRDESVQAIVDGDEQYDDSADGYDTARYFGSYQVVLGDGGASPLHVVTTADGEIAFEDTNPEDLATRLLEHVAQQDDNDFMQCSECGELGELGDDLYIYAGGGFNWKMDSTLHTAEQMKEGFPTHEQCERIAARAFG